MTDLILRTWVVLQTTAWQLGERVRSDERGQTATEYILVLALVALIVLALTQSSIRSRAEEAIQTAVENLFTAPN
jgi:Flp pilus assembly pilin Flp